MRVALLCIFLLASVTASAGTLEKCRQKEKDLAGVSSCVQAERNRSANQLRDLNPQVLKAVNEKTREAGRKTLLRKYRTAQAHHVRDRNATCRKKPTGDERTACEADMDYAHIEQIKQFMQ